MPTHLVPELKNYKLLDLIGCGGMGFVYIGFKLDSEQMVAIKVLSNECAAIPAVLERFKLEGEILKSLKHPNIVKFVEAGSEGSCHYLVMEYVKGLSLDAFPLGHSATTLGVKRGVPTMEEYLNVFIGCLNALDYVHHKELIHRDIKPQNIILRGNEHLPCLIDFGIAKSVKDDDDMTLSGERLYTVAYASPEQLTSKPLGFCSDLFSFGVVMYEKLTGYLPFAGKKEMEVFLSQTKWNFPPPRQINPGVPQKLEQIVLKMLAKNVDQRYPTAKMLLGELERLLDIVRQGRRGLTMSGIQSEIRDLDAARKSFKRTTLSDEQAAAKRARAEYLEAKNQFRTISMKMRTDPKIVGESRALCETLRFEYEKIQEQIKMALGFKSQPLVIDRLNAIFKLETVAFEKRGAPFTINTIDQSLATIEGSDIIVGSLNFSEKAKRSYSINQKDTFLAWDSSNWFFNSYEEKDFPIFLMLGSPEVPRCPTGFKGFFWPFEFLVAVHKLGWIGVSIIESFTGVDRNGNAVYARHKETIMFSNSLFDEIFRRKKALA